ncbi:hypothetical protein C8Q80DRAFT_1091240 [Daedaleopsis nitida]|nr:hypothetical protein C8Q80DRAFT_1091240 [Daedaleopsis nitida]
MAAPAEMTSRDISGKFIMNKTLSDDSDEILRLQGVSWFTRKAIGMATLYLAIKHFTEDGIEHVDIEQTITGGIKGTNEHRILDWTERTHEDHVFGPVFSKSRRVSLDEVEKEWLKKDWSLAESLVDGKIIYTTAKSDTSKSGKTWSTEQVWGFEQVNGEKRYTRHVFFVGPKDEIVTIRLVYDYGESILVHYMFLWCPNR